MENESKRTVAVIGAGLVGLMQVLVLLEHNFRVLIFESRKDPELQSKDESSRSINLTISRRGVDALKRHGLENEAMNCVVPVKGRLIHKANSLPEEMLYGNGEQFIYSIKRSKLHSILLQKVRTIIKDESQGANKAKVEIFFSQKLKNIKKIYESGSKRFALSFAMEEGEYDTIVDYVCGCDGINSVVRKNMTEVGCREDPIAHRYIELLLPANSDGGWPLDGEHLHIWPQGEFMLLALPNTNKSFTLTLFMPESMLPEKNEAERFFNTYFPDVVALVTSGKPLHKQFLDNEPGKLRTVRCRKHYDSDGIVLLGDAAHAILPFYGQGLNAGFEDCMLFSKELDNHGNDFCKAAETYSQFRYKDTDAIADLSEENYIEMRSGVKNPLLKYKKQADSYLHCFFPKCYKPLYSMIVFDNVPYSKAQKIAKRQSNCLILTGLLVFIMIIIFVACTIAIAIITND
ncbi:kynurenine 3-monooxygenase-like [Dysidea avara]|uniref:kynurenine 3-monooxygenase-like n=1 Tax=Dysidea avara TaxID=196820 RepID=UPI00332DFC77